jgi:hypothetical protein
MGLAYSKQITLTYLLLSLLGAVLFEIGKISSMPVSLGITAFLLFFAWKVISEFFSEQKTDKIHLLVYWGIILQLSLQSALLHLQSFRYEVIGISFLVFFAVLFIIYRYQMQKELVLLNVFISMFTCTIYFNF